MNEIRLISPFPEPDLPRVYAWTAKFREKTPLAKLTLNDFVRREMSRRDQKLQTWAVERAGEIGAYVEFEAKSGIGYMDYLSKPEFFKGPVAIPAIESCLAEVFGDARSELVLFAPLKANTAMGFLLEKLGAKYIGFVGEKSLFGISAGGWQDPRLRLKEAV